MELCKKLFEITCNSKSPRQQGTIHSLTVLLFHVRISKGYYCCRNIRKAGKKKKINFKSHLEGVKLLLRHFSSLCLYLPTIYCVLLIVKRMNAFK